MMIRGVLSAITLLAVAAMAVLAGCDRADDHYLDIGADERLNAKILELQKTETSAPLKDLTDFEWDAVYTYYEGVDPARINSDIGTTVFQKGSSLMLNETLAVFTLNGRPILAMGLLPIRYDVGRHSADVVLDRGYELVDDFPISTGPSPTATPR